MKDPTNEVEVSGVRIKGDCLSLVQRKMIDFPSIRFLYNPMKWPRFDYYDISFGGKVKEVNEFEVAIKDFYYEEPKEEKIPFFQRLLRRQK
jgi:hypothetical protein